MDNPKDTLDTYKKSWDAFLEAYYTLLEENRQLKKRLQIKATHG